MHTNFLSALKLIQSYLSERKQRSKINQHIVLGRKFFLGLPTDLYFVQFYLTFFSVIWFLLCKLLIYQILLTTAQLMMQVAILTRSYFTFKNYHFKHLSNKTKKKLRALARVTLYITLEKKKIVMNFFFNAQFSYCPLIWMLHSRKNNNKNKHLHEPCLRLICSDKKFSYENLLEKD